MTAPMPVPPDASMIDPFGRHVSYLRVSVTDRCDFRCVYCMSEHMSFLPKKDLLTLEELDRLCSVFVGKGVRKLRITGGEPLVRKQFRNVIDVNLMGSYWMAQAFARAAKSGGAIVNISSILGMRPGGLPQAAYASSKAGVIGLTRDLAAQWTARKGIRVNALAPGYFPSEMTEDLPDATIELVRALTAAQRIGRVEELASTLIWLVSDASSYVSGVTVPVDGGFVMP